MSLNCPRQTPSPQKVSERERERTDRRSPLPRFATHVCAQDSKRVARFWSQHLTPPLLFLPQRKRKGTLIVDQVWSSPPPYINLYTHLLNWFKAHYVRTKSQQLRIKAFLVKSVLQKKTFYGTFLFFINKINKPKYRLV